MIRGDKDSQSVTSDWEILQTPIAGVVLREVRHVPKDSGHVTELFRADWDLPGGPIEQVFQMVLHPRAISAWHRHERTTDRIFVTRGLAKVVLFDDREGTATRGVVNVFRLGDVRPALLVIPVGVWHGVQNLATTDCSLVNAPDFAYAYSDPDHWRLPADTTEIPYRFGD